MKKLYNKYRVWILIPAAMLFIAGLIFTLSKNKISTIRAFGDLLVDFKSVLPGQAIFKVLNFLPGDSEQHDVDVNNAGTVARYVAVKGFRTGPSGQDSPYLEDALNIKIYSDTTLKYDNSLQSFFDDSHYNDPNENGILLDTINPGDVKNYNFVVSFPSSSENEYKSKSVVFDLTFGIVTADHIVINEVFYNVDFTHGIDSWKDRGMPKKDEKKGNDDEWIELYNPTNKDISLKDWTLTDNSTGKSMILHANKIIKAGGFVLISKDASMWKYWDENSDAVKIESIDFPGDGLDNIGDHLILKDSRGNIIDKVGWGNDKIIWAPAVPNVLAGSSIERIVPGFDNDLSSDWITKTSPTPGN